MRSGPVEIADTYAVSLTKVTWRHGRREALGKDFGAGKDLKKVPAQKIWKGPTVKSLTD